MKSDTNKIFKTNKRIKLGIWGLGRGMAFYKTCKMLNIDVVAGCDYNEFLRDRFVKENPGAYVSDNADDFLAQDIDAVLLATYCVNHTEDAIKVLRSGKHVLSEVTSFFTMAEGVKLIEEVEKSGLVYNLAENYPFMPENMYLAKRWKEGFFGDLMYAEYEYVHEGKNLTYTYLNGNPIEPGNTAHSWRSWMSYHYYCTHSLGPVMIITGARPTKVVAMPNEVKLDGYLPDHGGLGKMAPSLIHMDNGSVVRNLMGSSTNDTHFQRLWGTRASSEFEVHKKLHIRIGAKGNGLKIEVTPKDDKLTAISRATGHGGGDFWVLYYFAREIFTGESAPFNIYAAADVTIPGILACRSAAEGGKAFDVPNFRNKKEREKYRNDNWRQEEYDFKNIFPKKQDTSITLRYNTVMKKLINYTTMVRTAVDGLKIADDVADKTVTVVIPVNKLATSYKSDLLDIYKEARKIVNAYPNCDAGRATRQLLENLGEEKDILSGKLIKELIKKANDITKKYKLPVLPEHYVLSKVQAAVKDIKNAKYPAKDLEYPVRWIMHASGYGQVPNQAKYCEKDSLLYMKCIIKSDKKSTEKFVYATNIPAKFWLNGKCIAKTDEFNASANEKRSEVKAEWKKGDNEVIVAFNVKKGQFNALVYSARKNDGKNA